MPGETAARFKAWFWRPPRPHGEALPERSVSNLELLYDLVYVAVIGQASHSLAEHLDAQGVFEFAVLFGLIWTAWVNGSLYIELHGRLDGRTRLFVFVQMAILALLAVFTGDATGNDGAPFAVTYAAYLGVTAWLWLSVRRRDRPEFLQITGAYLLLMAGSIVVLLVSAFLPPEPRLLVWAVYVGAWVVAMKLLGSRSRMFEFGVRPSDSMVERFDLFTIIVLGEVVIGVVAGLSASSRDALTIATGIVALVIGFGYWWMYFDVVGRRLPRADRGAVATWIIGHFPITLAIGASGAAMVSLIEHADDAASPPATAWLLSGAVALGLVGLIITASALEDVRRLAVVFRPLMVADGGRRRRRDPRGLAEPGAVAAGVAPRAGSGGSVGRRARGVPPGGRLGRG